MIQSQHATQPARVIPVNVGQHDQVDLFRVFSGGPEIFHQAAVFPSAVKEDGPFCVLHQAGKSPAAPESLVVIIIVAQDGKGYIRWFSHILLLDWFYHGGDPCLQEEQGQKDAQNFHG